VNKDFLSSFGATVAEEKNMGKMAILAWSMNE